MTLKKLFYFSVVGLFIGLLCFSSFNFAVAENQTVFFVESQYDATQRSQITATLQQTSERAYFYTDSVWWESLSLSEKSQALNSINSLASEFDNVIYGKLTSFFGDIWSPGIDNDPRITILFFPLTGKAGGYINYSDEYSKSVVARSNEREMVYLNTDHLNKAIIKSFLAHEFQHLITFYQKDKIHGVVEDVWLNEARSEYSPTYLGYDEPFSGSNLENRVATFSANPSDPLCEFKSDSADYGLVNIFMQYLAEKYGQDVISESTKDEKVGIESINNALKKRGYSVTFQDVFTNWVVANFLNNCSAGDLYCYNNLNLSKSNLYVSFKESTVTQELTKQETIKDWQALYYQFEPVGKLEKTFLKLSFKKENTGDYFKIPYIVEKTDGTFLINFMEIVGSESTLYISEFGDTVKSVTVVPLKESKVSDFTTADPSSAFSLEGSLTEEEPLKVSSNEAIRLPGDEKIYMIDNGKRHWIPNPEIFAMYNLNWSNIKEVTVEEFNSFPRVKLLRAIGDEKVYYLTESGMLRHIPSAETFLSYGNKWADIVDVDAREIAAYSINDLIKLDGDPRVYKIENGTKRWIKTASAFNRLKFDWSKIAPVNKTEFNTYPNGEIIY